MTTVIVTYLSLFYNITVIPLQQKLTCKQSIPAILNQLTFHHQGHACHCNSFCCVTAC